MNFDNFFNDANWRSFSPSVIKATGAYPNRLYHNANENLGVVAAFRGAHNSWALNEVAVNYIRNAVRDGRIVGGYAILAEGTPPTVVSCMEIEEVATRLRDVLPMEGNFGPYWWVNKKFMTGQSAVLADAPF